MPRFNLYDYCAVRGGAWYHVPYYGVNFFRTTCRYGGLSFDRRSADGFRCIASLKDRATKRLERIK
jgi:hypothetical protein